MTSEERREARYQRRIKNRQEKKNAKISRLGTYDDIFSYEKLFEAFYLCKKGVRWKASIQTYEATLLTSTFKIYETLKSRKFRPMGFLEFDLCERGKMRHIRALRIEERCIQRTLCDNYLNPLLQSYFIYDNGASIKNKGTDFVLNRLKCHLSRYYRHYHTNEGYVLQFDFSSYFDNINHKILLDQMEKLIPDKEIFKVIKKMIECFGKRGLGLGSQVSQTAAIFYPTLLDRYIKETLKMKGYCRYMDDGIIICHNLMEVEKCKQGLNEMCNKLDITLNMKKLTVSKLSKTFIFLKKRIRLTESGAIVERIGQDSVRRARRRIKKLTQKAFDENIKNFNYVNLYQCYKCWLGNAKRYQNYYITQNYRHFFLSLVSKYTKEKLLKENKDNDMYTSLWTNSFTY